MLASTASLLAAVAVISVMPLVNADFWMASEPLVIQRLDPVMQPGARTSNHTHIFHGANILTPTYSASAQAKSTCSTLGVGADLSSYWYPSMYYNWPNGSFSLVQSYVQFYYRQKEMQDETIIPYPKGLMMVAGYPFRRTINRNNVMDLAITYYCGDDERLDFPDYACPEPLAAKIVFPACWDGKNLMKPDLTHVAYPIGDPIRGHCPATHPKRFLTLSYEFQFETQIFPYRKNGFVFSFGDATGLGFHADFISQWDTNILSKAISDCRSHTHASGCSALTPSFSQKMADACRIKSDITKEDYGRANPIPKLLGDNPVWTGTGPKPSCNCNIPKPSPVSPNSTLATGFKFDNCYGDWDSQRLLGGAQYTDNINMSGQACTAFCAARGFTIAGTEASVNCYCANSFTAGTSMTTIDPLACNVKCWGNREGGSSSSHR